MIKLVHGLWLMVHRKKILYPIPYALYPKHGFTLVELMVAIAIVAILATIGAAAYRNVLKDSRNAKRQADLRAVQSALEQYHNDQRYYPSTIVFGSSLTNATGAPSGTPATRTYLNLVPSDPQASNYIYQANPSVPACDNTSIVCTRYCLYAKLETTTVAPAPAPCVYTGSWASYNLAITSP